MMTFQTWEHFLGHPVYYLVVARALGVALQQPVLGVRGEQRPHLVPGDQRVPRLGELGVQVQLRAGVRARHQAPLVVSQDLGSGG